MYAILTFLQLKNLIEELRNIPEKVLEKQNLQNKKIHFEDNFENLNILLKSSQSASEYYQ